MDIVNYYTEISKQESFKIKEVREFSDTLDDEFNRVVNLKFNRNIIQKIIHPFVTIKSNIDYRRLNKIKKEFNYYLDSSVLLYDNGDFGEPDKDLEGAATYYKPQAIKEYVKKVNIKRTK